MTKPDIEAHQYYLFTEKEMKVAKARGDNMHSEIEIAKQSQPYGRLIKTFRLGDY